LKALSAVIDFGPDYSFFAVLAALQMSADQYSLASLRYDLCKLRAKALVEKLPKSRRYRLCPQGYSICLVFLKLFNESTLRSLLGYFSPTGLTPNCSSSLHRSQISKDL